jgi:CelD/BcsL family acetyltransferase involved in cellulose biosynthesis
MSMSIASLPQTPSRERLSSESVVALPALQALEGEWQRLWQRAGARPFQSPGWLIPWYRHVGRGELACVAVREGGELVGFAPLYVYEDKQRVRHLFPLGIATTDYLDAICAPGREQEVVAALAAHIASHRDAWDVVEAPQLDAAAHLLRCCWPASLRAQLTECEPNPVVPLARPLPASFAQRLERARRRIARQGRVDYEAATASSLDALLGELARLHASRWAQRELPGVLGDAVMDWHREAARQLQAQGLLRLIALKLEGRIIGVIYAIADAPRARQRRWYSYIGGFDPAWAASSPGSLLLGHAIDRARAEAATHFDLLRGAEEYKYRWGAIDQPMFALSVTKVA